MNSNSNRKKYNNDQERLEAARDRSRRWYHAHKEISKERAARWREENLDRSREHARNYARRHKKEMAAYHRQYNILNRVKVNAVNKLWKIRHKQKHQLQNVKPLVSPAAIITTTNIDVVSACDKWMD